MVRYPIEARANNHMKVAEFVVDTNKNAQQPILWDLKKQQ